MDRGEQRQRSVDARYDRDDEPEPVHLTLWQQGVEDVLWTLAFARRDDEPSLAEVVEYQAGKREEPGPGDRCAPEVFRVGVEGFPSRSRQEHRSEDARLDHGGDSVSADVRDGRVGAERPQNLRGHLDAPKPHPRQQQEPDQVSGSGDRANEPGPALGNGHDERQDDGDRKHPVCHAGCRVGLRDALHGGEQRDRGRQRAVRDQETGGEGCQPTHRRPLLVALESRVDETRKWLDPSSPLVVRPQRDDDVLHVDERQGPEDQGDRPHDVAGVHHQAGGEDRRQDVQRARPDVAQDAAQRRQRETPTTLGTVTGLTHFSFSSPQGCLAPLGRLPW